MFFYFPISKQYREENEDYKFCGIVSDEESLLRQLDDRLNNESNCFGFKINEKGNVKNSVSEVVSKAEFDNLLEYSHQMVKVATAEIADGHINAYPLDGKCKFCMAKNICISGFTEPLSRKVSGKKIKDFGCGNE